jgi:hypothetical protein
MLSPFFMKKAQNTALPGKMANHGFFYKISLGKNGFWTKINVHFRSANHFLCFDILSKSENLYQKTSKNNHFFKCSSVMEHGYMGHVWIFNKAYMQWWIV